MIFNREVTDSITGVCSQNRPLFLRKTVTIILRFLLGGVFLFSGLAKIFSPISFVEALSQYPFLTDGYLHLLALLIPALEYLLGFCLLLGLYQRKVILTLMGLILIFSGALFYQLLAGNSVACGCFGGFIPEPDGWWALARNGILLLLNSILLFSILSSK